MYCVKCGVKLSDGVASCPLCQTPVLYADGQFEAGKDDLHVTYSDTYPTEKKHINFAMCGLLTAVSIGLSLFFILFCLNLYGTVSWGGIVSLGIALNYVLFILPLWMPRFKPYVFLPVDFASIGAYLLYINCALGQHWYLGFAFPVVLLLCANMMLFYTLFRYVKGKRLLLSGILICVAGCQTMLVELFSHVTFGVAMWRWSLYCVTFFCAFGLFLIIAHCIRPLKELLERKFFV